MLLLEFQDPGGGIEGELLLLEQLANLVEALEEEPPKYPRTIAI